MNEFDLIEILKKSPAGEPGGRADDGLVIGIGDDAAVMEVPANRQLVVTTDSLVEGVHFLPGTAAADLGYKALAVNLSDLAAMGAEPAWFLLAVTLPRLEESWLADFAAGMGELSREAGIRLAGGDVNCGPLNLTVTACGLIERGRALTRSGARAGDLIAVSGPTGLAALALRQLQRGEAVNPAALRALNRPRPRLALGRALVAVASSCIDISDGLLADLNHVLEASGVGAELELSRLPAAEALPDMREEERWSLQLGGGDDYELCFTIAPDKEHALARLKGASDGVSVIGRIVDGGRCQCLRPDGTRFEPPSAGYVHGGRP